MSTAADSPEDCPLGEECGVHHRVNARYEEGNGFLVYTDYIGEYLIITSQRPVSPVLLAVLGMDPYDTAILKVGDMSLSDKARAAYAAGESDESWIAWETAHSSIGAAREGHEMILDAFDSEILDLEV